MSLYRLFRTSGYLSSSIIPVKNPEKMQKIKVPDTVGDDLDRFVENLKIGQIQEGKVDTLQFLQMTEDELKQFENKDPEFLSSYADKWTSPMEYWIQSYDSQNEVEFIRISGERLTMLKQGGSVSYMHYESDDDYWMDDDLDSLNEETLDLHFRLYYDT